MNLASRLRPGMKRYLWLVLVVLLALLIQDLYRIWRITNHHDLEVFVLAAKRLAAGQDIYADAAPFRQQLESGAFSMKDDSIVWPYVYSPLIALLFMPLHSIPMNVLGSLWWALNVASLLLGSWIALKSVGPVTPGYIALALVLLIRFYPAEVALRLGQIEVIQFLLLAGTLYALSRHWEMGAGVALGLAAGLKFFPGALIALFIWRRRWRAAIWAALVGFVTILGSFAAIGLENLGRYASISSVYGLGASFSAFPYNQSLNGLVSRNLVSNVFSATLKGLHLPGLAVALILLASICIVALSAWFCWHRRSWPSVPSVREDGRFALEYSLAIMALLLISPHSQIYSFVWCLIPLIVLSRVCSCDPKTWICLAAVAGYILVGRHLVLFVPGLTRFFQSHLTFGAVLLWAMIAAILYRGGTLAAEDAVTEFVRTPAETEQAAARRGIRV